MSKHHETRPTAASKSAIHEKSAADDVVRSDNAATISWWKRLLYQERRRHGQVESILTRQIIQLEKQVDDLRRLYFSTIAVTTSPRSQERENDDTTKSSMKGIN